jgi:predicted transcriptional regulator with HTH domain
MQKRFYPLPTLSDATTVLQSVGDKVIRRATVELRFILVEQGEGFLYWKLTECVRAMKLLVYDQMC